MCLIITEYDCKHTERHRKPCQAYMERVKAARKKAGFWKSLFARRDTNQIECPAPPGRRAIYRYCPYCVAEEEGRAWKPADSRIERKTQEEEAKQARRTWDAATKEMKAQIERTREEHAKIKQQRDREKARQQAKQVFLCSACTVEGRHIDQRAREVNGGLCCARGIDEFPQWENHRDDNTISPRKSPTSIGRDIGTIKAKAEASAAAKSYGWRYNGIDSAALEPNLVREYLNISGADTNALPAPQPKRRPLYQELLIDQDRWASAYQTSHGRLPPAMEKPLPVLPLSPRKIPQKEPPNAKPMQRNLTPHHIVTDILFSSQQLSQKHNSSEVSPLSQTQPRPTSIMSRLSHDIDDEMRSWSETNNLDTPINPGWI